MTPSWPPLELRDRIRIVCLCGAIIRTDAVKPWRGQVWKGWSHRCGCGVICATAMPRYAMALTASRGGGEMWSRRVDTEMAKEPMSAPIGNLELAWSRAWEA